MSAARATIHAGVCGFVIEVVAISEDEQHVRLEIASPCEKVRGLAKTLTVVDAYHEICAGLDGQIHSAARAALKGCCSGCVVPSGIFKAMQVAGGLALARDVSIELRKAEEET